MKDAPRYDFDPTTTDLFVIFADGSMARIVKTYHKLQSGLIRFYLVPTSSLIKEHGLKAEKDKRYDQIENCYVFDIKEEWATCVKPHPVFQRWLFDCDWFGNYYSNIDRRLQKLQIQVKALQEERDAMVLTINHLNRELIRQGKHQYITRSEIMKEGAKMGKEFTINPLAPPMPNQQQVN